MFLALFLLSSVIMTVTQASTSLDCMRDVKDRNTGQLWHLKFHWSELPSASAGLAHYCSKEPILCCEWCWCVDRVVILSQYLTRDHLISMSMISSGVAIVELRSIVGPHAESRYET